MLDKKEKIYRGKDVSKWGLSSRELEDLSLKFKFNIEDLKEDKDFAFKYMLPNETTDVEQKRHELGFYTS